jgi:hypothetical protein
MRFPASSLARISYVVCLTFGLLLSAAYARGQAPASPSDFKTKISATVSGPFSRNAEEPPGRLALPHFTLDTGLSGTPPRIGPDLNLIAWNSPAGRLSWVQEQNPQSGTRRSNAVRKVRKGPLILGLAGAAVMAAGIAAAADSCGLGPCFRSYGVAAAVAGGAGAVTGFYFAFRR